MEFGETAVKKAACFGLRFSISRNGREVAHAFLYIMHNSLHPVRPFGLLEDVFVSKKYRGQGLGRKLISEVVSTARRHKCYKLVATSRHSRPRVHELYKQLGFEDWGTEFRMNF